MSVYEFDATGENPNNKIYNEEMTILEQDGTNNYYYMPDASPFFEESMIITDSEGYVLEEGVDYVFGHEYESATTQLTEGLAASIVYTDTSRGGNYKLTYQTLGSDYTFNDQEVVRKGLEELSYLQTIRLEDVANVPEEFEPSQHGLATTDIEGVNEIIDAIHEMIDSWKQQTRNLSMAEITDLDESFVTPLMSNLADIATGLDNLRSSFQPSLHQSDTSWSTIEASALTDLSAETWHDTPLSVTLSSEGSWKLDFYPNAVVTWVNGIVGNVEYRWVADGFPLAQQRNMHPIADLLSNQIIKLQIKATGGTPSRIDFKTVTSESSMIALKLSN